MSVASPLNRANTSKSDLPRVFVLLDLKGSLAPKGGCPRGGVFILGKSQKRGALQARCIVAFLIIKRWLRHDADVD